MNLLCLIEGKWKCVFGHAWKLKGTARAVYDRTSFKERVKVRHYVCQNCSEQQAVVVVAQDVIEVNVQWVKDLPDYKEES